eukprot:gnl/TRDRNA2_/TRDRNA2_170555_c1_seq3.p1 gnl/TRDRNA2_/TRDRNA2_170555_c1~~gnl/TRDRNA2_/TRDRNA2_170555_c1_seq3.p1  ORF type:complete len:356 (+),score=40.52 gnl/TRDRNA2_/TRDRNA2_170555_c1_seq3:49-1116(+)
MYSVILSILFVSIAQAHGRELSGQHSVNVSSRYASIQHFIDHLYDRKLKLLHPQTIDMDNTMLGKPSKLAIPSQTGLRALPSSHYSSSRSLWANHRIVQAAALGDVDRGLLANAAAAFRGVDKGQLAAIATILAADAAVLVNIRKLKNNNSRRALGLGRRVFFISLASVPLLPMANSLLFAARLPSNFKRLGGMQFIAALGDPAACSGTNAKDWGIWRLDPGPRGVRLENAEALASGGITRAGWKFDKDDWWLEEHGLIMEKPEFPLPAGRYAVNGGRQTNAILTVKTDGAWELDNGKLYDVTHLPCRAARYTGGSLKNARLSDFPVEPGAAMPAVSGSDKQDYAVLFVTAIEKS